MHRLIWHSSLRKVIRMESQSSVETGDSTPKVFKIHNGPSQWELLMEKVLAPGGLYNEDRMCEFTVDSEFLVGIQPPREEMPVTVKLLINYAGRVDSQASVFWFIAGGGSWENFVGVYDTHSRQGSIRRLTPAEKSAWLGLTSGWNVYKGSFR